MGGIALLGLGAACASGSPAAALGLLVYSALVTLYLAFLGLQGEWVGVLLWPAVALHAVLTPLLEGARRRSGAPANPGNARL